MGRIPVKLKKMGVEMAVLFGSTARGEEREDSDVDIGVKIKQGRKIDFELMGEIREFFLTKYPGKNVDIRFLNGGDGLFLYEVFSVGKLIYGDELEFNREKIYRHNMFVDYMRYDKLRDELFKKKLRSL